MAGTSRPSPATDGTTADRGAPAEAGAAAPLRALDWLRVALIGALAAAAAVVVFDLLVAEPVLDRAIALEETPPLAAPDPFTRGEQQAGLVLGELLFACGVGLLLAGAGTLLAPRARSPRRLWLAMVGAAGAGAVVAPFLKYPPLPPGAEAEMAIAARQLLYLLVVGLGIAIVLLAARAWHDRAEPRRAGAALLGALALVLAIVLLPAQTVAGEGPPGDVLRDFRAVSLGSQAIFWAAFAAAGAWLLRAPGARR